MRHLLPLQYIDAIAKNGSIRKAADQLAITPSALYRRLVSMEEELGVQFFERVAKGMRLSAAGELMLGHVRNQISDLERVKSRIADLSGMRRGHVTVGCSSELHGAFLPTVVREYQNEFPEVTFEVLTMERGQVEDALIDYTIDIGLVFEPMKLAEFQTLYSLRQPIMCCVDKNHSLANRDSVRMYECCEQPVTLPSGQSGLRHLLENSAVRLGLNLVASLQCNRPEALATYSKGRSDMFFELPINLDNQPDDYRTKAVPVDSKDINPGFLFAGHLRARALPVAAARFLENVVEALAKYETSH